MELGFAGRLAKTFLTSKLTPVAALVAMLLGLFAVILTPKEEEPQISVPMIDIRLQAMGLEPREVERTVVEPIERGIWGLEGVEYVYSTSQAHGALVTVRFKVGEPMEPSLVKVHHKLMTLKGSLPPQVSDPQVDSYSIDDVPFLTLTFHSATLSDQALREKVVPLAREFSGTPDLSKVSLLGGLRRSVRIEADAAKLEQFGLSMLSLSQSLQSHDLLLPGQKSWGSEKVWDVEVGGRLAHARDIESLAVAQRGGRIIRVSDVAKVREAPEELTRMSRYVERGKQEQWNAAVSIVFAKRKGTNVVILTKKIIDLSKKLQEKLPSEIQMSITRDYGTTAEAKSHELIEHLMIATLSVAVLIGLFMGFRAALVVAIAIPVTLALTLAIYYFLGYTLNRVTLFALIFSIGILVDDAIVVVENVERHLHSPSRPIRTWSDQLRTILEAVAEVGNPTILATFTVIASILPMAFVRGLMGPYMKPIPVGASMAMLVSLFVAFMVTPWAAAKLMKFHLTPEANEADPSHVLRESRLDQIYRRVMNWLLSKKSHSLLFGLVTGLLLVGAMSLVALKVVRVKMLPFDNKNEFQILVDFPVGTPLEKSVEKSRALVKRLLNTPEVDAIQVYAGEAAPFSFSGMVKHTFLRGEDHEVDLQVVLRDKSQRKRSSHDVIDSIRPVVQEFGLAHGALTKVLEIPPGPPVLASVMAEVYGPSEDERKKVAREIYEVFKSTPSVVDLDTTLRLRRSALRYSVDPVQAGLLGVSTAQAARVGALVFSETQVATLSDVGGPEDVPVFLGIDPKVRASERPFRGQYLQSMEAGLVSLERVLRAPKEKEREVRHRKNLQPVSYVMSELQGKEEAPVYGMKLLQPRIPYPQQTAEVPWDTQETVVKWDGEWFITYEVFRDLGGAFGIVMILIYILVLGWFRSFTLPLIIMAPIPISLIGIIPGHALAGFYFGAPSMIGFIAGAGIIVRNSIILVDFIQQELGRGVAFKEAIIGAGVIRFRPMLLTAAAVVVGSAVMLLDPIFQGLAISLIFGEVAATLISRFAVPLLYFWFGREGRKL
jgi:multidrug efflux pump subunit AcrB